MTNVIPPGLSFRTPGQSDGPLRMAPMPNLNMSIPSPPNLSEASRTVIPNITCNHFYIYYLIHILSFVSLAASTLASSTGQLAIRSTGGFSSVPAGSLPVATGTSFHSNIVLQPLLPPASMSNIRYLHG
jgi:hypothetical protein